RTLNEAFTVLEQRRRAIEQIMKEPGTLARLAVLEPNLQYDPELARVRADVSDHEVRGKLVFKDLLGKGSFFKVADFEIAGIRLREADARLLGDVGVRTQLADPGIWPRAATRRVAAGGGGLVHAVVAGVASLCTQRMAVLPVAGFMRFLDR